MREKLEQLAQEYIEGLAPSDPNFDISTLRYEYDVFLEGAEAAVKLLAAPAVSKCEGLQGRELLLAFHKFQQKNRIIRNRVDSFAGKSNLFRSGRSDFRSPWESSVRLKMKRPLRQYGLNMYKFFYPVVDWFMLNILRRIKLYDFSFIHNGNMVSQRKCFV